MSFIGSLLGLLCARKARIDHERRVTWLLGAAVSIGGTGIWVMHFIAMLGFSVGKATVRYNVPLTLLSAIIAIAVVGLGLFIVSGREQWWALALGGTVTGLGVAAMHYIGMAAINTHTMVHYQLGIVMTSVLIAVVAATAALWFTMRVSSAGFTVGAAAIMAVAVSGMHYTGMASMRTNPGQNTVHDVSSSGAGIMGAIPPLIVIVSLVTILLLLNLTITYDEHEFPVSREKHAPAKARI